MRNSGKEFYEFGHFRLDAQKHRLLCDGEVVPLSPKAMETLLVFVRHPGKPLEREELMREVWAGSFVEDANLTVAISHLRKAFGRGGETEGYIETIPRVGYRFVAEVRTVREEPTPLVIEKHTLSQTVIEEEIIPDTEPLARETAGGGRLPLVKRLSSALTQHKSAGLLTAVLLAVGVLGASYSRNPTRQSAAAFASTRAPIKSIAVIPPKTIMTDAQSASLSFGLADALSAKLGGLHKLQVRSAGAVSHYPEGNGDALAAGRALGVDAVLEGSLQHEQGKLRLTLRLLQVSDGTQLWAGSFDRGDADIFGLEDSASQQLAEALSLSLQNDERNPRSKRPTQNQEAYTLYLQGNYFWNRRGEEVLKSYDYFRRAIELDPNFALPYVGLAKAYATQTDKAVDAEVMAEKALRLDPDLAEAHATYGFIRMFLHWDWAAAGRSFDRAIELDPDSVTAHHWKGVYLSLLGRLDEAEAEMRRALELDPLSMIIMADLGQLHYFAHEYDEALGYCRRAVALDNEFEIGHLYLRDIYIMKGMYGEAFDEWYKMEHSGSGPGQSQQTDAVHDYAGFQRYIKKRQEGPLRGGEESKRLYALFFARNYVYLGDGEQALAWLNRAAQEHLFLLPFVNVDPLFDSLRGDPRFQQTLRRLNLPTG